MVFLPDLSDGSDVEKMEDFSNRNGGENGQVSLSSNCNTLETMSARSFGFIKPSQKIRDNDMASRIRRHKSFFNADTSSISPGKLLTLNSNKTEN